MPCQIVKTKAKAAIYDAVCHCLLYAYLHLLQDGSYVKQFLKQQGNAIYILDSYSAFPTVYLKYMQLIL